MNANGQSRNDVTLLGDNEAGNVNGIRLGYASAGLVTALEGTMTVKRAGSSVLLGIVYPRSCVVKRTPIRIVAGGIGLALVLTSCSRDTPKTNSSSITKPTVVATTPTSAFPTAVTTLTTAVGATTSSSTSVATVAPSTVSVSTTPTPSVAPSPDGSLLKPEEVQKIIGIPVKAVDGCTDIHLCVMDSTVEGKMGTARVKSVQVRCDPAADVNAGKAALAKAATPAPLTGIAGIGEAAASFSVKDGANRDHYAMGFYKNKYTCIVSLLADPYTTDVPDLAVEKVLADAIARIAVQRVP